VKLVAAHGQRTRALDENSAARRALAPAVASWCSNRDLMTVGYDTHS